ncbi:hypothetical protein [Zooshikella sp. RANM57]|uniref:hypothetical protein n=1 Tax=Zooshikella sp. RANM57 TaxID=3425863 RepID=UPI003D6E50A7
MQEPNYAVIVSLKNQDLAHFSWEALESELLMLSFKPIKVLSDFARIYGCAEAAHGCHDFLIKLVDNTLEKFGVTRHLFELDTVHPKGARYLANLN